MIRSTKQIFFALCCAVVCFRLAFAAPLQEEALVAVATNFVEVAEVLVDAFESRSEYAVSLVAGSTGKLYSQVVNGAPFDVLLAADQVRPQRLLNSHMAVAGSQATYATGQLTLWSPDPDAVTTGGRKVLAQGNFRSLAIANPSLAPYGSAAQETLINLGLWEQLETKIVMGENVGQAHAMVSTRNAEFGLVALSYVVSPRNSQAGSRWDVPAGLHKPIKQDVVLLQHGAANLAARAFLEYLLSEPARATIRSFGYAAE
jgi:molybdate transport system substrate-binding protein